MSLSELSSTAILAFGATVGLVVIAGVALVVAGARGLPPRDPATPSRLRRLDVRGSSQRVVLAAVVGLLVLVVTRWVVLALALGALVLLWDRVAGASQAERVAISRIDGLASWTESLRDTIAGAVGLEQAIPATTVNAAPSIRPALNLLVDRLRVREPLPSALTKFADDLDDPSADLIVAALILNARLRGPGLREVLSALATSVREELDLRRRVQSGRRSTRRSVQIVLGVSVLMVTGIVLFNGDYVRPYDTPVGQLVLLAVIALYALGILWLRRLSHIEVPDRFLIRTHDQRSLVSGDVVEV